MESEWHISLKRKERAVGLGVRMCMTTPPLPPPPRPCPTARRSGPEARIMDRSQVVGVLRPRSPVRAPRALPAPRAPPALPGPKGCWQAHCLCTHLEVHKPAHLHPTCHLAPHLKLPPPPFPSSVARSPPPP
eukprot:359241-Chlamydomonas_euryale.AAC.6